MEPIPAGLSGLGWLILFLVPLILIQRLLHREIQLNLLLLTRRPDLSVIIFSLIFLPGVFLHETSHFLAARLMGVRTGRFSIIPRAIAGGKLQLGYVETAPVDWLRESIIGIAPLVSGMAFVAYAGLVQLQLTGWWDLERSFQLQGSWEGLKQMQAQPDFWLWFYLVLTVSSMMFPSSSDRRSWLPMGITAGILLSISIFLGAGPWMALNLAPLLDRFFQAMSVVFAISLLAHVLLYPPSLLARLLLTRLMGVEVA
ncbi:MAG: hypothetical protein A2Z16_12755 [Chloroflexi bacterium RBG_16_54_18]|nr:MAG: hypothetical protein A2Z16_12755 [Chloroflexi bacterium RBG_16_54_18]